MPPPFYDHRIYVDHDDEIQALQSLPLFHLLLLLPLPTSSAFAFLKKKKRGGRGKKKERKRKLNSPRARSELKRIEFSNIPASLSGNRTSHLPTLICLSGASKKRGVICLQWKERRVKKRKEEKGGNAPIFRPSRVKRDTVQPVENGGEKGNRRGEKNRNDNDDK